MLEEFVHVFHLSTTGIHAFLNPCNDRIGLILKLFNSSYLINFRPLIKYVIIQCIFLSAENVAYLEYSGRYITETIFVTSDSVWFENWKSNYNKNNRKMEKKSLKSN